MFTGIVRDIGTIDSVAESDGGRRARIRSRLAEGLAIGGSVSVSGACLTVVGTADGAFDVDIVPETLRATTLGSLAVGSRVNLEPAVRAGEPLDGALVAGHVDGTADVLSRSRAGADEELVLRVPDEMLPFLARKGSVTVDGVNLTVADMDDAARSLKVALIPHTLAATTLGTLAPGDAANVEVDLVARYAQRLAATRTP